MARFKIGQKVVALEKVSDVIKKGEIYIVDGYHCCPGCGLPCIFVKDINVRCASPCLLDKGGCGYVEYGVRASFEEVIFAPLTNIADAIEYRLKVSIPELTEIKEVQHQ